jgi:predicted glutamine amidotransferase
MNQINREIELYMNEMHQELKIIVENFVNYFDMLKKEIMITQWENGWCISQRTRTQREYFIVIKKDEKIGSISTYFRKQIVVVTEKLTENIKWIKQHLQKRDNL